MLNHKFTIDGTFHEGCLKVSLLQLVGMVEHGTDIKSQVRFGAPKTAAAVQPLCKVHTKKEQQL